MTPDHPRQQSPHGLPDAPNFTDGVIALTRFTPADAPVLCAADDDPEMRLRFDCPPDFVPSLEHTLAVIARWARAWEAGERYPFAVRTITDGVLVGGCELWPRGGGVCNVSYWTYPAHRRAGFAVRSVARLCTVAFEVGGFERLEIVTDPDNIASRRIALRNGFEEAGLRDGQTLLVLDKSARSRGPVSPPLFGGPRTHAQAYNARGAALDSPSTSEVAMSQRSDEPGACSSLHLHP